MASKKLENPKCRTELPPSKNYKLNIQVDEDLLKKESHRLKKDVCESPKSKKLYSDFISNFAEI